MKLRILSLFDLARAKISVRLRFLAPLTEKVYKICCNSIQVSYFISNPYFLELLTYSLSHHMAETNTISKEKSFEESNQITNTVLLKEKLEAILQFEDSSNIEFHEDCYEIVALMKTVNYVKSIEDKGSKLYQLLDKISIFMKRYSSLLTEDSYKLLNRTLININLAADLALATSKITEELSEKTSYNGLKHWANWIELFVEFAEINQDILTLERSQDFQKLAENMVSLTFIKHPGETKKNKLKRSLKHSAIFLLAIVDNWNQRNQELIENLSYVESIKKPTSQSSNTYILRLGEKSYHELLAESQKRIHLLDDMRPKTDEEIKYQLDTLNYLREELKWNVE